MRSLPPLALGLVCVILPAAARAQPPSQPPILGRYYGGPPITVRQATAEEVGWRAVRCPMLLDLSLSAYGSNRSFQELDTRQPWIVTETAAFSCDRERIDVLRVDRTNLQGKVQLRVLPELAPELPGRTVDLTVAFIVDGVEVRRQSARVDTRGVASGARVDPLPEHELAGFNFEFSDQEFAAMFAGGRSPVLRIILDV